MRGVAARRVAPGSTGEVRRDHAINAEFCHRARQDQGCPSLALGGSAALDPACARCRRALIDGVGTSLTACLPIAPLGSSEPPGVNLGTALAGRATPVDRARTSWP